MRSPDMSEIFALEASNSSHKKALLSAACIASFEADKNQVVFMTDTAEQQEIAQSLGFMNVGFYEGYRVML